MGIDLKQIIREKIYRRYPISFAKSGDDIQLYKLIKQTIPGAYVDIGCWHPYKASNTYFFYLRGWKGICIDPNPDLKATFSRYRKEDTFINAAVSNQKENLTYYFLEEAYDSMNTVNIEFIKSHKLEGQVKNTIQIPSVSLKDILDKNLVETDRLDFFDIDVEGYDLEVLKSNDWGKYRPKIIMIESTNTIKVDINSEIVGYLNTKEYRLVGKTIIQGDLGNLFLIDENVR